MFPFQKPIVFPVPRPITKLRVALEDGLGEQLAARDLDAELPLEPEDDVQKVDRLRPQVAHQRSLGSDILLVDA